MTKLTLKMHRAGFFSNFNKVINHLHYSVEEGKVSAFELDWQTSDVKNKQYHDDGNSDLWGRFFEPIQIKGKYSSEIVTDKYANINMTGSHAYYKLYMGDDAWRHDFHKIYKKYIKLCDHIEARTEEFYFEHMQGRHCIGVHLRNRAISIENPFPPPATQRYIEIVREQLSSSKQNVIFLATDVSTVIDKFKSAFGDQLCFIESACRSSRHWQEIHYNFSKATGADLAKDVLLDCLLLSKVDTFVHSTSNVATAVGYINPNLKMIYARYKNNDCRAMEPTYIKNPDAVITKKEDGLYKLVLNRQRKALRLNEWVVMIINLCDGSRTRTDLIEYCREIPNKEEFSGSSKPPWVVLNNMLSNGVLLKGQSDYPKLNHMFESGET